jgi:pimeloyl-ACP methyl ester carboxylesterase
VHLVTTGSGAPLVVIPRLEGRWEYLRPAVDALARSFRVLTFSLAGEPSSGVPLDRARGLDNYVSQVIRALDQARVARAAICGVSFGGVVAIRFAATQPARTAALVLASTPGPTWRLKPRHVLYARAPWLWGPLFVAETPWRLRAEMAAAFPRLSARLWFALSQVGVFVRAPLSLARMAERVRLISALDLAADCARITAPTLVVTGERRLDHIVPVEGSSEYVRLIPGARGIVLDRTGHQGVMTRPEAFADLIRVFLENPRHAAA